MRIAPSRSPRGRTSSARTLALAAAGLALVALPVVAAPAAAAAPAIKKTGKRKPSSGYFTVAFQGQGTYGLNYQVSTTVAELTHTESIAASSTFRWDWTQNRKDALLFPYPCKQFGLQQCKSVGPSAELSQGSQSLAYKLAESKNDTNSDPVTNNCSGSLTLQSTKSDHTITGPAMSVTPTNNFKDVVISVGLGGTDVVPFGDSDAENDPWSSRGQGCQSITTDDLWFPTNASGALTSSGVDNFFVAKSVPIPIATISSASTVTVGLSGPKGGNGPKPLCGIGPSFSDGVTCTQTGSWSGSVKLTRVQTN